jgi:hypothetical protein
MDAKTQSPVTVEVGARHDADHATEVDPCGKLASELSFEAAKASAHTRAERGRIFRH